MERRCKEGIPEETWQLFQTLSLPQVDEVTGCAGRLLDVYLPQGKGFNELLKEAVAAPPQSHRAARGSG